MLIQTPNKHRGVLRQFVGVLALITFMGLVAMERSIGDTPSLHPASDWSLISEAKADSNRLGRRSGEG